MWTRPPLFSYTVTLIVDLADKILPCDIYININKSLSSVLLLLTLKTDLVLFSKTMQTHSLL